MKKLTAIILVLCMMIPLAACGKTAPASTSMANPVHECSKEELAEKVGIPMEVPEAAADVRYSYIEGEELIAQIDFKLDGKNYCFRSMMTSEIFFRDQMDGNADMAKMKEEIDKATKAGETLSGCYEKWTQGGTADVSYCPAVIEAKKGGMGFICWFDVVPGILYSLSVDKCSSGDELIPVAEQCFVSAQGEA